MILQYFKKKENEYKIKSDIIYLNILNKSKLLLNKKYFNEINFSISFEIISVLLIFYLHFLKDKSIGSKKRINEELVKNLVNDLDKSLRDAGISDMSIGKYVKKYVKKFYYRLMILDEILQKNEDINFASYIQKFGISNYGNSMKITEDLKILYNNIVIDKQ
tara:strand:+ start:125 stop:610 length:486 start_codon:yes stop_codon:yes gene_type:complete